MTTRRAGCASAGAALPTTSPPAMNMECASSTLAPTTSDRSERKTAMLKAVTVMQVVEALESGKYEQAQGVLHSKGGGFCCLELHCIAVRFEYNRDTGEVRNVALTEGL